MGPLNLSADHRGPLVVRRDAPVLPRRPEPSVRVARAARPSAPFTRVAVLDSLAAAESAWRHLEGRVPASPYQTFAWACAWMETEGRAHGVLPCVGVAFDEVDQPVALLPFGLTRRRGLGVVRFLGGRHANYNLGLFDPALPWTSGDVGRLLRAIADAAGHRVDVFALVNEPLAWNGWANPLALLPHQPSPSDAYRAVLDPDGEAFLQRHQSSSARKKLRYKTKQAMALGTVTHRVAASPAEVEAVLDAYMAQKSAKLAAMGAGLDEAALARARTFFARAATEPAPSLELHALHCGDRIVATFGGLSHDQHFAGLMISHDADPMMARVSPGEILLAAVIKAKCAAGFTGFDLGIGESRYKQSLCPIADPLVDSLVPMSRAGQVFVLAETTRLRLKRAIKRSAWAWPLALAIRRRLAAPTPRD